MTDINVWLAEARTLADQATEGPWDADGREITQHWQREEPWLTIVGTQVGCIPYCYGGSGEGVERDEDAAFIADARTRLPQALDALQAVLKIHAPIDALNMRYRGGRAQQVCTGCGTDDGNWNHLPCPTVRAITDAIGEHDD